MSAEKIINIKNNTINAVDNFKINEKEFSGRVDINRLLARVRNEKQEENKINFIFFIMFAVLVLIAGILLSF
tara:strand:+ start:181 stop:396 length:216 start_codon:yes stop_codon:yes gene_type:complete